MTEPLIRNISDTARWAAAFRAQETERHDALFRDPLARRLAGERGQQIATAMTMHTKNAWSWVMRTHVVDQYIERQLAGGVDTILNLAAGLDTRPYRMAVPSTLRWIEVDLPELLVFGDLLVLTRLLRWTRTPEAALEARRPSKTISWKDTELRLTLFGRRVLEKLRSPSEAPALLMGGHEIYGPSTFATIPAGRMIRL